jgi:hypothetical protein
MAKLHHALVLALVGWYLMVPPNQAGWDCGQSFAAVLSHQLFGTGDDKLCAHYSSLPDLDAPLSQWTDIASYDTAAQCHAADLEQMKGGGLAVWKCVASDDPRLKGN